MIIPKILINYKHFLKKYKKRYENLTKNFLRPKTEKRPTSNVGLFECGKVDFCIALFVALWGASSPYVAFPQFEVKKVVEKRVETCVQTEEKTKSRVGNAQKRYIPCL